MEPKWQLPFKEEFPVTFAFGALPPKEEIKKKFQEWGIVGHHGVDYGIPGGTEVVAADAGKVVQAGENGDFGISVTLEHPWGQSFSAHLKEVKVEVGDEIKVGDLIGLSGETGAAFGEHLHFGIKPNNADLNNGYLGFIDPAPYLVATELSPPPPPVLPKIIEKEIVKEVPVEVVKEMVKEVSVIDEKETQRKAEEKFKAEIEARRQRATQVRQNRQAKNLEKIQKILEQKGLITNEDVRELLHVSQTTATRYLQTLVGQGFFRKEGKGKATIYRR